MVQGRKPAEEDNSKVEQLEEQCRTLVYELDKVKGVLSNFTDFLCVCAGIATGLENTCRLLFEKKMIGYHFNIAFQF